MVRRLNVSTDSACFGGKLGRYDKATLSARGIKISVALQDGMDNLLNALNAAAALYKSSDALPTANKKKPWMTAPLSHSVIAPVEGALELVPAIFALSRLRQFSFGCREGKQLYPAYLASALVKRTAALGAAQMAVAELQNLVTANEGRGRIVMVLAGVQTAVPVELAKGIWCVPLGDLEPPSWIEDFGEKTTWPLSRTFAPVAPSAALVKRVPFSPLFSAEDEIEGRFPEKEVIELQAVAHCIALVAHRPPAILKVWYEDDDPRLPLLSSGITFSDPRWGSGAAAPYEIDADRVRAIFSSYQRFSGDRTPLDTAMLRLADAWGDWRREDRVIDLGISLEAVLMYKRSGRSNDNSEIGYKLRIRAGWLMGETPSARLDVFKTVGKLYDYRSQAAHTGKVKTTPKTWRAIDDEIEDGIALAGQILLAVLKLGEWPNWDSLVLGEPGRVPPSA